MTAGNDPRRFSPARRRASLTRTPHANHARPYPRVTPTAASCLRLTLLAMLTPVLAACTSSTPPDTATVDTIDESAATPAAPAADTTAAAPPESAMARDSFFEGSESIWLDAERRGVTFRAVGQEPAWLLEFGPERQLTLVTDYGAAERILPLPAPVVDSATWTTTYRVRAPNVELRIEIRDEPCADTMSGERFHATVTVVLNRVRYSGCGRVLDLLP